MGKALYRKYRPKALAEIVGQEHVTTALNNALKKGAISHAYLFTGPRGTGKTSIARILAHEVNQLPYDEEKGHLDIIEIDAASNRRIDEIRELRERVHTAPTSAKYKVYIIDEVHMLTKEAFNALLKTLEEPPAHVIFIMATTEAHKLPDTIISRTQRFSFKPAESSALIDHLKKVAKSEKIAITDDALALVAEHGGGSYRDSMSLLDQARNSGEKIDIDAVRRSLGIAPSQAIEDIWQAIQEANVTGLVDLLGNLRADGYQSGQLAKQLAVRFRQALVEGRSHLSPNQLIATLQKLLEVPLSHDTDTALEIVLIGLIVPDRPAMSAPLAVEVSATPTLQPVRPVTTTKKETQEDKAPPTIDKPEEQIVVSGKPLDNELWGTVLDHIKKQYNTLYGLLRMAEAHIDGDTLTLRFKFAFHQKRINEAHNKKVVVDSIKKVSGQDITLVCVVVSDSAIKETPTKSAPLDTISNIFGGAEVIE